MVNIYFHCANSQHVPHEAGWQVVAESVSNLISFTQDKKWILISVSNILAHTPTFAKLKFTSFSKHLITFPNIYDL